MILYFGRNSSVYKIDTETSMCTMCNEQSVYVSIVEFDGHINDFEGENVEVKQGDYLFFRGEKVSTLDKFDRFIKSYKSRKSESEDICSPCTDCISESKG